MPQYVQCTFAEHGQRIQEIYNKAILETTATYDHEPYSLAYIEQWFQSRQQHGFPIIGALSEGPEPELMGFATYDYFRGKDGYNQTVEHSIYLHTDYRGHGLGAILLEMLIEAAAAQKLHVLVGVIDAANQASIHLHEKLGFEMVGTLRQSGPKFGKWLDVSFLQLILPGSEQPPAA